MFSIHEIRSMTNDSSRTKTSRRTRKRMRRGRSLRFESMECRKLLTTYTVDSVADDGDADISQPDCQTVNGECTLRAAIEQANATPGRDQIHFDIPGSGPHTIQPIESSLPIIWDSVELELNPPMIKTTAR